MDLWEMFSELCRQVAERQDVMLDIYIDENGIEMALMPYEGKEEPKDDSRV